MVAVNVFGGIKYGFRLMGYVLGVLVIGAVIMFVGLGILDSAGGTYASGPNFGQLAIGGLVILFGVATIYAGFMGTIYKVIADGVEKGNRAANQTGGAPPQQPHGGRNPEQPPAGRQR